jgi:hypothetical protein
MSRTMWAWARLGDASTSRCPGGVVGNVHRGVSNGLDVRDVGRGMRAVAWERAAVPGRTRLPERPEPQLSWRISGRMDRAADA